MSPKRDNPKPEPYEDIAEPDRPEGTRLEFGADRPDDVVITGDASKGDALTGDGAP